MFWAIYIIYVYIWGTLRVVTARELFVLSGSFTSHSKTVRWLHHVRSHASHKRYTVSNVEGREINLHRAIGYPACTRDWTWGCLMTGAHRTTCAIATLQLWFRIRTVLWLGGEFPKYHERIVVSSPTFSWLWPACKCRFEAHPNNYKYSGLLFFQQCRPTRVLQVSHLMGVYTLERGTAFSLVGCGRYPKQTVGLGTHLRSVAGCHQIYWQLPGLCTDQKTVHCRPLIPHLLLMLLEGSVWPVTCLWEPLLSWITLTLNVLDGNFLPQ